MLARRIIPCLDVKDRQGVVERRALRDHVVMGDAVEFGARYRDQGADELVFYDITASAGEAVRSILPGWREIACELDIPFCVAGGRAQRDARHQVPRERRRQGFDQLAPRWNARNSSMKLRALQAHNAWLRASTVLREEQAGSSINMRATLKNRSDRPQYARLDPRSRRPRGGRGCAQLP